MQPFFKKILLIISSFLLLISVKSSAQDIVRILDSVPQHIFTFKEIEVLEDPADQFSFEQINSKAFEHAFKASTSSTPQTKKLHKTYWFRIKIKHNQNAEKPFLLEFFDQTIDHITAYIPQENQTYHTESLGDVNAFNKRLINHKNFEIPIKNNGNEIKTYYFKIKSSQISDIIIVLRTAEWFISYQ